jgi:predicted peptidase
LSLVYLIGLFIALSSDSIWAAAPITDRTLTRFEKGTTDAEYGYVEFLPHLYYNRTEGQLFPLVLKLHGGGGKGNGTTQLANGSDMKLLNDSIRFDRSTIFDERGVIVVEPQSSGSWDSGKLRTFILYLIDTYEVDPKRIYVTGPSMGGAGTWNCVKNNGDLIAACVPICGRGPGSGSRYINVPTWAVHGWDDATIPYTTSVDQCNKIAAAVGGVSSTNVLANYPHL